MNYANKKPPRKAPVTDASLAVYLSYLDDIDGFDDIILYQKYRHYRTYRQRLPAVFACHRSHGSG